MRVLLIGAGVTGSRLAARLCAEKHDVVIVDTDAKALRDIGGRHDVMTVSGSGAHPLVLDQAGVKNAQLLVAVSSDDQANLLACMYGKLAGVERTVARLRNPACVEETDWFSLQKSGVDIVVSQNDEGSKDLFHMLMLPSADEVVRMLDGRLQAVGTRINEDSPLYGVKLSAFPEQSFLDNIRILAIMRDGDVLIPHGDTVLLKDDLLYVLGAPAMTVAFVNWVNPPQHKVNKIVIAGGGGMGLPLARRLDATSTQVVLIESSAERAEHCSAELSHALVLQGDALDAELLAEAGITERTAFVALTGSDERNFMTSILARQRGAAYVAAQINDPEYAPIIAQLKVLDRIVNAKETIINAILHMARWRNKERYTFLKRVPGELLEFSIAEGHTCIGKSVRDISMPRDALIAAIMQNGGVVVPTGETRMQSGDHIVVFALPKAVSKVEKVLGT